MNKNDRKILNEQAATIESIKDLLQTVTNKMSEITEDLQDRHDNVPEGLQDTEAYNLADEQIDELEAAIGDLESAIESVESAKDYVEEAIN